jgi:succinate dehydrogenase / fumarate reductase, cytochrome b subunit
MGAAGLGWTLFVAGHMAGNLLIFAGPEAFNRYGHAIVSNKPLLYGTEVFLVVCLLLHVGLGIKLTLENKAAKPKKYAQSPVSQKSASLASKTMAIHGSIILFFIIYHLITFKWGPVYWVEYQGETMRDLFRLVTEVFSSPAYVVGYIVCLFLLGLAPESWCLIGVPKLWMEPSSLSSPCANGRLGLCNHSGWWLYCSTYICVLFLVRYE